MIDVALCPFIREASYAIREPWILPDRRLLDYLLVVVERGTCCFVVEDRPYLLGPDQVFLAQPGDRITLEGITATVTPYLHCDIVDQHGREERFSPGPGFLDLAPYQHLVQPRIEVLLDATIPSIIDLPDPEAFRNQFVNCIGLWQSGTALNRMEAHVLLAGMFVTIWRAHLTDQPVKSRIPSIIQPLDSYMRHRLQEQITLQQMAEHVGFSVPHLIRLCRLHWNQTPHQHLLHLRLQHSLLLLQNLDLSITQIARYCGFADTQHFAHVFRKHMRSTPMQARMAAAAGPVEHQPTTEAQQIGRLAGRGASCARPDGCLAAGHSSDGDPLNEITLEGEEDNNDR
jgi:AraC-like DNA-binding protein